MLLNIESINIASAFETEWHDHSWGQLYWLDNGVINVETEQAQWVITPGSVGWTPADCLHKVKIFPSVQLYVIDLDCSGLGLFPQQPGVYAMNSLLRALLSRASEFSAADFASDYVTSLIKLLGHEVMRLQALPLGLPLPTDRRARNIAESLLEHPANTYTQDEMAKKWGLSVRTLSRIFINQTGFTYSQWRQQSKIITSMRFIQQGLPISEVASLSGYTNVSAFIEAFRLRFGDTPGKFRAKIA